MITEEQNKTSYQPSAHTRRVNYMHHGSNITESVIVTLRRVIDYLNPVIYPGGIAFPSFDLKWFAVGDFM